jgi:hypothetical protein
MRLWRGSESFCKWLGNSISSNTPGWFVDKFKKAVEKVQELDAERHKYTDGMIEMFKKLRGKTGEASS